MSELPISEFPAETCYRRGPHGAIITQAGLHKAAASGGEDGLQQVPAIRNALNSYSSWRSVRPRVL